MAGRGGVPNDSAGAVLTLTVIGDSTGYVTVWQCDAPKPGTLILNSSPGAVRANIALAGSRRPRAICLQAWTADGSPVHLLADVTG